jgi:uncharacterized protein YdeI (YjbR/CyaY-like superfamily)
MNLKMPTAKQSVDKKISRPAAANKVALKKSASKPLSSSLPLLSFATPRHLAAWLKKNHATSPGIWMRICKKDAAEKSVTYAEALDEALCFGWIDGQKGALDSTAWKQRFTPRGPRSIWSKINRDKALALIEAGRMQPTGHAAIVLAKRDGRWEAAYSGQRTADVPPDLAAALDAAPNAQRFFSELDRANRYAILFRVHHARRPETRARKIVEFVAMLARGEKIHP